MLKDIKETPHALKTVLNTYFQEDKTIKNIQIPVDSEKIEKIYIPASGSSRNAANIARYFIEQAANIPVIVDYAGEFAQRSVSVKQNDVVIPVSQSGETADVMAALRKAKEMGMSSFSITNNENSAMHKLADTGMLICAGHEESIPATKTFTCQLMSLYILGVYLAEKKKTISLKEAEVIKEKLFEIPDKISANINEFTEKIFETSNKIKDYSDLIIVGRGQNFGLADETALKIQETSYINAFGYPTGEFMHGHLAILEEKSPIISIVTETFDNSRSNALAIENIQDIKDRRNPFIILIGHNRIEWADIFIQINEQDRIITLFLTVVLLQLLAYKTATLLERDTINPRSLKKTVLNE